MTESSFGAKLELALKAMSMSRARLAAELAVDKSLVGRWVSGTVTPSGHNLARLTQFIGLKRPGFSLLDWDRDLEGLAKALGVNEARRGPDLSNTLTIVVPPAVADAARTCAPAYEGFWRHTRSAGVADRPDMFVQGYFLMQRGANGLLTFRGGLFETRAEGWMLPVQNQLFGVIMDTSTGRSFSTTLNIPHGHKIELLDGVVMSCRLEMGGAPAAYAVVFERIGDLSDNEHEDNRRLDELMARHPAAALASIPEPIRKHLLRDFGPAAAAAGGHLVLQVPHLQSIAKASRPDSAES